MEPEERKEEENRLSEISDANFVLDHYPQVYRCNFGLQRCTLTPSCTSVGRGVWLLQAHISLFWIRGTFTLTPNGRCFTELEFRTGKLGGSTTNFDEKTVIDLLKSGPIRFSAVDAEFEHLVTVGEDKKLKVWELDGPKLCSQRFALASESVRLPSIDLHAMYQGSPKTADFVKPYEERPNYPRL